MPGKTLNTRYLSKTLTVPALTAIATPVSSNFDLGDLTLDEIEIVIPIGHAGLTGIAVEYDQIRIVPWSSGNDWIIGDDDRVPFDINFDVGHPVVIKAYNTDVYVHTFYLRAKVHDRPNQAAGSVGSVAPLSL